MIDDDHNLTSPIINNNKNKDNENVLGIKKMQQNLIMMGFDIEMINKIITVFKIKTEEEALDYLIKSENGMWQHPFIPKEEEAKNVSNTILDSINPIKRTSTLKSDSINKNNKIDNTNDDNLLKINEDICEICGESKNFHTNKSFIYNNDNNINNNIDDLNLLDNDNHNLDIIDFNFDKNNNIENDDEIEEEINDINSNECQICMDELENPVTITKCNHKFCRDCFHSYLLNLIKNNQIDKIPCPKNKCKNKNLSEDFIIKYLSEQEYFKYCQFKSQNEIARDATKVFCPICESYADIDKNILNLYDSNSPDYIKSTLKCKKGHEFCSCGRPLHEGNCYKDEKEFKDFVNIEKIKNCPKCGFLIKKNKGCNHMICGNPTCRHEFCWLCMKNSEPGHYENGPCAGKQFIDPDGLLYKIQVNCPCLYKLYWALLILGFVLLILLFLSLPFISYSFSFFIIIFEENGDDFGLEGVNTKIKVIIFLADVCIALACQTIGYLCIGIILSFIGIFIAILIITAIIDFIILIIKCLCNQYRDEEYKIFGCSRFMVGLVCIVINLMCGNEEID